MNIDRDQIVDLLEKQGNHAKAKHAKQHLPQQVDTDKDEHKDLMSKVGLDPADLIKKFGGNLPGGLGDKLGGLL